MKRILVTQRVDIVASYKERRDALDQKWSLFLNECQLMPILVSNNVTLVDKILASEKIDGVLLTGGNSLSSYGGDAPERDQVERKILKWAISDAVPCLGVCRGMQVIQDYFGVALKKIDGHVGKRHELLVEQGCFLSEETRSFKTVNTYHDFGTEDTVDQLRVVARSKDNVVMSIEHNKYLVYGNMWHPEREYPFSINDVALFRKIFQEKRIKV